MNDYLCTGGNQRCQNQAETCCHPENSNANCPCNDQSDDCPCRRGFVQNLQMLLRTGLSSLVDFQQFAYVTPDFLVGATLVAPTVGTGAYDNLSDTLTGVFSRFTHCDCDNIDASGPVTMPAVGESTTGVTVSRLSLCDLLAVVFTVTGDTEEIITENYQSARALLQTLLQGRRRRGEDFPPYPDPCCHDCCDCAPTFGSGGTVSLVAGDLLVANATVLGAMGGVLVLANDTDQRFYFVCGEDAIILR